MGIPSYFSQLRRRYGKHLDSWLISRLPSDIPCGQLYVDLNGIIHVAAYTIIQRFEEEYMAELGDNASVSIRAIELDIKKNREALLHNQLYPRLFQEIVEAIQRLLDTACPTRLCYLAIDGVAPRAKMVQQRQRRYRAVQDIQKEHDMYTKHNKPYIRGLLWDSNCVTPGTIFMHKLEEYLHSHLKVDLKLPHSTTQIVLSDAKEPGEGEHKIMHTLRHEDMNDEIVVIYGQDADLLMLAFAYRSKSPKSPVYILRERDALPKKKQQHVSSALSPSTEQSCSEIDVSKEEPSEAKKSVKVGTNPCLQYVDIAQLETYIIRHLEMYGDLYNIEDYPNVMQDYVALCFLLGNDFLPHGPSLAIPAHGLDVLFEAYVPMRKTLNRWLTFENHVEDDENSSNLTIKQTHFDHVFLMQLIQQLAHQEDYLATKVFEHVMQKRKWSLQQQRYPRDQGYGKVHQHLHYTERVHSFDHEAKFLQALPPSDWASDDIVAPGTDGWQRRYYLEVERVRNMEDVHNMCRAYLGGMFWTLQYYCHGCWSTKWQYPYLSAPLLSNMASYLARPSCNVNRLVKHQPDAFCDALEQLKTVLPPSSYEDCVSDDGHCNTGVCGELVAFGKRYRWECPMRVVAGV